MENNDKLKLLRKIIDEEIHPDYENSDEYYRYGFYHALEEVIEIIDDMIKE